MSKLVEKFEIPEDGITLIHYEESGQYTFKHGSWGQIVMTYDTPKESGSVSLAGFEARDRVKKLLLKDWYAKDTYHNGW